MQLAPFTPKRFRRRVFSQLWMLALQFVLGMGLNLIGSDTRGASHVLYATLLGLHVLNALGIVEGGFFIALKEHTKLAWWGSIAANIAFAGGVATVMTHQDGWSFIMACGFLATIWLNGMLFVQADRRLRHSPS